MPATARLRKILQTGKVDKLGSMKRKDGTYTDSPMETLEILLDTHFPDLDNDEEPN